MGGVTEAPAFSSEQMQRIASHAAENLLAMARGLTPNYYAHGMPDGTVGGEIFS